MRVLKTQRFIGSGNVGISGQNQDSLICAMFPSFPGIQGGPTTPFVGSRANEHVRTYSKNFKMATAEH